MNWKLKLKIVEKFRTQSDFSAAIKCCESYISRVVRGRQKISDEQKKKWAKVLNCKQSDVF